MVTSMYAKTGIKQDEQTQRTSDAPKAEWEPGLMGNTGDLYVTKPDKPSGLPAPLEGSESQFQPQRYPAPSGPMSSTFSRPGTSPSSEVQDRRLRSATTGSE
jgi:hypothetical protein